jgi:NAD(P)-dependent dehydrogenase (short-subunit alcohol dehydrogenase family)
MDLDYRGRVALVTGGSSGIGRAIVLQLAAEGATVALTYRNDRAAADRVAAEAGALGTIASTAMYDLADPNDPDRLVQRVLDEHGQLDLLVTNAVAWPSQAAGAPVSWRTALRTNLEGTIATVEAALPHLLARRGRIVVVSSSVATDGMPGATAYGSAKAGLHGLVATLSVEHAPSGLLINAVLPGLTLTERAQRVIPEAVRAEVAARTPTRQLTAPSDVARAIALLGSPVNQQITGQLIRVDGGL